MRPHDPVRTTLDSLELDNSYLISFYGINTNDIVMIKIKHKLEKTIFIDIDGISKWYPKKTIILLYDHVPEKLFRKLKLINVKSISDD